MKKIIITLMLNVVLLTSNALAEEKQAEHLIDGSSMNYFYETGEGIHLELNNGKLKYEWIAGSRKGKGNKDLEYSSQKLGIKCM